MAKKRAKRPKMSADTGIVNPATGQVVKVNSELEICFKSGDMPGLVNADLPVTVIVNGQIELFADDIVQAVVYAYHRLTDADPYADLDDE